MYDKKIGIVGLGYVGLTLATALAEVGFEVYGSEKKVDVLALAKKGQPHFTEVGLNEKLARLVNERSLVPIENLSQAPQCNTYILTVGTPINEHGRVNLNMIKAATEEVAKVMPENALIILRSTVKIGTARSVVEPILKASGKSFELAMCPERTLEGNALKELNEIPQIVGADTQDIRNRAAEIFQTLTRTIVQLSSLEAAETAKLLDNTYRDVNFAFANEVARLCDAIGLNASEIIAAGKLGYPRTNIPLPGPVGGPCLEKDPHILMESLEHTNLKIEMTQASRLINERLPDETINFIYKKLSRSKQNTRIKITLLGLAFKGIPETDDLRGSMSIKILQSLRKKMKHAKFCLYDPVISQTILKENFPDDIIATNLTDAVSNAMVVVIANNHSEFASRSVFEILNSMDREGFIYDYWNNFSSPSIETGSKRYFALGNTRCR